MTSSLCILLALIAIIMYLVVDADLDKEMVVKTLQFSAIGWFTLGTIKYLF